MRKAPLRKQLPDIGAMREPIAIEAFSVVRDPAAGEVKSWGIVLMTWALVEYPSTGSMETYLPEPQQTAFRSVTFTMRHDPVTIDEKMRVAYENKVYDIERIEVIGAKRFLKLTTKLRD